MLPGALQTVLAPAQCLFAPVHWVPVVSEQEDMKQQAPVGGGCGQGFGEHTAGAPCDVPPRPEQFAGVTNWQEPFAAKQQARGQGLGVQTRLLPW